MAPALTAEHQRLADSQARRADWKHWGPYVAERAWGTVREDYSPDGDAWNFFPHDHARSRAYRWNEDGLAGFCNRFQNLCMAIALWNGRDPILKERLFGLSGPEGNHGEDVKEYYYYLDATPTHSFMRMLYKYPQVEYPYARLGRGEPRGGAGPTASSSCSTRSATPSGRAVTSTSSSSTPRPTRRTSSAGSRPSTAVPSRPRCTSCRTSGSATRGRGDTPPIGPSCAARGTPSVRVWHKHLGERWWYARRPAARAELLVHRERDEPRTALRGPQCPSPYVKDAFHEARDPRPGRPGQSRPARHEGRRPLPRDRRHRARRSSSAPGSSIVGSTTHSATSTPIVRPPPPRG